MTAELKVIPVSAALKRRRTMSDHIVKALRDAIFAGVFEDGAELNQVALAEHFGISRVPVREALRQLQAEGLIEGEPHRRVVVVGLDRDRLSEIFEIRTVLERYLLEKAFPFIGKKEIARLRKLCDDMDRIQEHDTWLSRNRLYHETLYEPSGARITLNLVRQLSGRVQRYMRAATSGVERKQEAGLEHRRILELIERRDLAGAMAVLETHIGNTGEQVLLAMAEPQLPRDALKALL